MGKLRTRDVEDCVEGTPGNKLDKLNPRWKYGVLVGVKVIRGEIWVTTRGDCRP